MNNHFKSSVGFSLAEVLIAIAIVGIIATMVIPGAVEDVNKKIWVNQMKDNLDLFQGAARILATNNKGSLAGYFTSSNDLMNKFCTSLDCVQTCLAGQNVGICYHAGSSSWRNLSNNFGSSRDSWPRAILANGTLIAFEYNNINCDNNDYIRNGENMLCSKLHVDINGFKGPNTLGRDLFEFWVIKDGLIPDGAFGTTGYTADWNDSASRCADTSTDPNSGHGCAGRIIIEGGMNY